MLRKKGTFVVGVDFVKTVMLIKSVFIRAYHSSIVKKCPAEKAVMLSFHKGNTTAFTTNNTWN